MYRARALVVPLLALAVSALLGTTTGAHAATPRDSTTTTPWLAAPWGHYTGNADPTYVAWKQATGANKALLGKVALQPKMQWFGSWIPTSKVASTLGAYISNSQAGNPDALVQMAIFRLWPNGEGAKNQPLSASQQSAYKAWIDAAASTIGDARVAMVLEPDLGVALKGWQPSVRLALAKYAAMEFSALPRTSVYLDASDADWLKPAAAVSMLESAGVSYARGFALGATHYAPLMSDVAFGKQIISGLTAAGIPNRHFVIDSSDDGRPFTYKQYFAKHPHGDFDNAQVCTSMTESRCDTLGRPPTANVTDPSQIDAYLWFGRPWLVNQASPFSLSRTLAVARTTPF